MNTKIEWCDMTWNPVWGCKNNCGYCYARKINQRFKKIKNWNEPEWVESNFQKSFPKRPSRIFVNSMSDIAFWKTEWMTRVLKMIEGYPQHTFMFLTKKPEIYYDYCSEIPKNCMIGFTATNQKTYDIGNENFSDLGNPYKKFVSIEPIHDETNIKHFYGHWIVVGAETGNRKDQIIPKKEWIEELIDINIPLFMKDNLKPYWNGKFRKEFPL